MNQITKLLFPVLLILLFDGSSFGQADCDSVTAGIDQTVCAGAAIQLQGSSPGATNIVSNYWTGGNGVYVPGNNVPNPLYYPTAAEIAAGEVNLQYHLTYNAATPSADASLLAYDHLNEDSIFYISPIDGSVQGVQSNSGNDLTAIGYQSNTNLLYGISNIVEPPNLFEIDVITNAVTLLISNLGYSFWAGDFDNLNQLFYVIGTPYGAAQQQGLFVFDFSSGTPVGTYIGPLNLTGDNNIVFYNGGDGINGLAYDPNTNRLYGVSFSGQLYDINPVSGNATLIGDCQPGLRGLAYDYTTNKLWGCDEFANLYELDENTGTLLNTVDCQGDFVVVTSLTFAPGLIGETVTCTDSLHIDIIDCNMNCSSQMSILGDSCTQEVFSFSILSDSSIVSALWNFGDPGSGTDNTSNAINPDHTFSSAGSYTVTAIVNLSCGTDTLTETITVVPCETPETLTCELEVPNIFTPNADGINDHFAPNSNCLFDQYDFFIVNRWGELVFTASGQTDKWDGKYNGTNCSEGVYFYVINYQFPAQQTQMVQGMVTLSR
ncbi:gliding motility-associated C-terminal domain-containing protein [Fluviicola sp.]|uniref:T9SS type B sorting domain-containing protein n=1 Tax=Fluviicola sp. TaxID=1917219 RepID=UPI0031E34ABA